MSSLDLTAGARRPATGRLGPWLAAVWLFFLANPLLAGWADRDELRGVLGMLSTLLFAGLYLAMWWPGRRDWQRLTRPTSPVTAAACLGALLLVAVVTIALVGEAGLACLAYVGVAAVLLLPLQFATPVVVALVVLIVALGAHEHWGSQVDTAFATMAAAVAVFGLRTVLVRNLELVAAQEENARLAVEHERTRFARDLHDILGHSLTVITVKAELAGRLLEVDPDRARGEVGDLEQLSRDALADVRRAVAGYRDLTLPGEIARARAALGAAGIEADLPRSTDQVAGELRELFAWTVREGVTNVLRHSRAERCEVRLEPTSLEVRDDGVGDRQDGDGHGSGLAGLRERAAAVGATVVTRDLAPGFSLRAVRR